MKTLLHLGTLFLSLVSGGIISASFSFYSAVFVEESLPTGWIELLASAVLLLLGGGIWAYLSVLIADIEGAFRVIPQGLAMSEREDLREEIMREKSIRVLFVTWLAIATSVAGVGVVVLKYLH